MTVKNVQEENKESEAEGFVRPENFVFGVDIQYDHKADSFLLEFTYNSVYSKGSKDYEAYRKCKKQVKDIILKFYPDCRFFKEIAGHHTNGVIIKALDPITEAVNVGMETVKAKHEREVANGIKKESY